MSTHVYILEQRKHRFTCSSLRRSRYQVYTSSVNLFAPHPRFDTTLPWIYADFYDTLPCFTIVTFVINVNFSGEVNLTLRKFYANSTYSYACKNPLSPTVFVK